MFGHESLRCSGSVIVENRNYRGLTRSRSVIAGQHPVNIQQRRIETRCEEESQVSSSSHLAHPDSTVREEECSGDKRKIFNCEYDGCNKKYTKLSHLKVRYQTLPEQTLFRKMQTAFFWNIFYIRGTKHNIEYVSTKHKKILMYKLKTSNSLSKKNVFQLWFEIR